MTNPIVGQGINGFNPFAPWKLTSAGMKGNKGTLRLACQGDWFDLGRVRGFDHCRNKSDAEKGWMISAIRDRLRRVPMDSDAYLLLQGEVAMMEAAHSESDPELVEWINSDRANEICLGLEQPEAKVLMHVSMCAITELVEAYESGMATDASYILKRKAPHGRWIDLMNQDGVIIPPIDKPRNERDAHQSSSLHMTKTRAGRSIDSRSDCSLNVDTNP